MMEMRRVTNERKGVGEDVGAVDSSSVEHQSRKRQ